MKSIIRFFALCVAMFAFVACDALFGSKPTVIISSPASGSQYQAGQDVAVQSTSSDSQGIARVELIVDGGTPPVKTDASPTGSPQSQFTVIQVWNATGAGQHTITVRATDGSGTTGEAAVTITVVGQVAAVSPTPTSTIAGLPPIATTVPSSTPSLTSTPTSTPVPGACSPNAQFIADVTIPDGTTVAAGSSFVKTWRVRNSGSCTWDSAYTIVFAGGEQFGAPSPSLIPQAAPGAIVDLSLSMIAPGAGGSHFSSWRLRTSGGALFGTNLTAVINVPGAPPPGATATSTSTPLPCTGTPNDFSFTASSTTIVAGNSVTLNWSGVTNATSVTLDPGAESVATPGSRTKTPSATTVYILTATCSASGLTRVKQITVNVIPPAPVQVSPNDGKVFRTFPRSVTFDWNNISFPGGVTYNIEIQVFISSWGSFATIHSLGSSNYTSAIGADNQMRWRVWATSPSAGDGAMSAWREFHFNTGASQYSGTWLNDNSATNGITKIIITNSGQTLFIHPFGKCSPTDCDWGTLSGTFGGEPFVILFDFGGGLTHQLTITLNNDAGTQLKVVDVGSSSGTNTYTFHR